VSGYCTRMMTGISGAGSLDRVGACCKMLLQSVAQFQMQDVSCIGFLVACCMVQPLVLASMAASAVVTRLCLLHSTGLGTSPTGAALQCDTPKAAMMRCRVKLCWHTPHFLSLSLTVCVPP
jgi:hypothetical protein